MLAEQEGNPMTALGQSEVNQESGGVRAKSASPQALPSAPRGPAHFGGSEPVAERPAAKRRRSGLGEAKRGLVSLVSLCGRQLPLAL